MSRYPFDEFSHQYMESMRGIYADATFTGMSRRFRRMSEDVRSFYKQGMITTTSPKQMTVEDVRVLLQHKKSLGHSASEYQKEVNAYILLFEYCENPSARACLRRYPLLTPSSRHVRLPSLPDVEVRKIIDGIVRSPERGEFRILRSYVMLGVFLGCGTRTKELRLLDRTRVDFRRGILNIEHVKGEGSYGEPRSVPIPPFLFQPLAAYMDALDAKHIDSPALFPPTRNGGLYMTGNTVRKTLGIALSDLGISTDPRTLRRTFGQILLDSGIDSIESVSVLMGHNSTVTTEHYYARRRNDAAVLAAENTWSKIDEKASKRSENGKVGAEDGKHPIFFQISRNKINPTEKRIGSFSFFTLISEEIWGGAAESAA